MKKFEYKLTSFANGQLSTMGELGWELCAVSGGHPTTYYWKREKARTLHEANEIIAGQK